MILRMVGEHPYNIQILKSPRGPRLKSSSNFIVCKRRNCTARFMRELVNSEWLYLSTVTKAVDHLLEEASARSPRHPVSSSIRILKQSMQIGCAIRKSALKQRWKNQARVSKIKSPQGVSKGWSNKISISWPRRRSRCRRFHCYQPYTPTRQMSHPTPSKLWVSQSQFTA